ncbi:hypothetical protein [Halarcobacter sp.]|uniref:hypothetical protein n=1 Tax=Halarcobacter sp. TaxID=2321133 RepID=UPI0029F50A02|nr:hypothetical protein [Halarcobacter sp.]
MSKNYFSFFGILLATISIKIHSYFTKIATLINTNVPKITKLLLSKALKPVKQYSTNNL